LCNINRLLKADKNTWEITLEDKTITSREYYNYWIMVQFCLDIKKNSYTQLLKDATTENKIKEEMMKWYKEKKANAQQAAY
jgi:hypothetical protein